ncbi:MAG: hypothetical protein AB1742_06505, partial [bacterium]
VNQKERKFSPYCPLPYFTTIDSGAKSQKYQIRRRHTEMPVCRLPGWQTGWHGGQACLLRGTKRRGRQAYRAENGFCSWGAVPVSPSKLLYVRRNQYFDIGKFCTGRGEALFFAPGRGVRIIPLIFQKIHLKNL